MLDGGIIGEIGVEEKSDSKGFGDREKWGVDGECGEGVGWYAGAAHCVAGVRGVSVVVVGVCGEGVGWYAGVAHCIVGVRGVRVVV